MALKTPFVPRELKVDFPFQNSRLDRSYWYNSSSFLILDRFSQSVFGNFHPCEISKNPGIESKHICSSNSKFEWLHNDLHNDLHNVLHNNNKIKYNFQEIYKSHSFDDFEYNLPKKKKQKSRERSSPPRTLLPFLPSSCQILWTVLFFFVLQCLTFLNAKHTLMLWKHSYLLNRQTTYRHSNISWFRCRLDTCAELQQEIFYILFMDYIRKIVMAGMQYYRIHLVGIWLNMYQQTRTVFTLKNRVNDWNSWFRRLSRFFYRNFYER